MPLPNRPGRIATRELTRIGLVVGPPPRRHGSLVAATLLALAAGVGLASALPHVLPAADPSQQTPSQRTIEQQRLALGLAEARAQELERQIDTLNRQQRECREELTFFRQARDAKR